VTTLGGFGEKMEASRLNRCTNISSVKKLEKIWKAKLPLKIKIFMCLIHQNSILTKDKLLRRGWNRDSKCMFCREDESVLHLFFECSMAKYIWSMVVIVMGATAGPLLLTSFGTEWKFLYPASKSSIWWDWPGFAGLFGEPEIMYALKEKM